MAIVTVRFDTESIEDSYELRRTLKATDMAIALWSIESNVWRDVEALIEAGDIKTPYDCLKEYQSLIKEAIDNSGLNLESLIN